MSWNNRCSDDRYRRGYERRESSESREERISKRPRTEGNVYNLFEAERGRTGFPTTAYPGQHYAESHHYMTHGYGYPSYDTYGYTPMDTSYSAMDAVGWVDTAPTTSKNLKHTESHFKRADETASRHMSDASDDEAPHFEWLKAHEFGVAQAMAAAKSGKVQSIPFVLRTTAGRSASTDVPTETFSSSETVGASTQPNHALVSRIIDLITSGRFGKLTCRADNLTISATQHPWLPQSLSSATINVGCPSVGLGNKLFLYFGNLLAGMLLRKEFTMFPMPPSLKGLPETIEFDKSSLTLRCVSTGGEPASLQDVMVLDSALGDTAQISLRDFLHTQTDIGRLAVQFQPSFFACASLMHSAVNVVRSVAVPFIEYCCQQSQKTVPTVGEHDWVVHVRVGDIWLEPGERSRVNACYAQPPAWWYRFLSAKYKPKVVRIVCGKPTSTLVAAVKAAFLAGNPDCEVLVHSGLDLADFGLLMRHNTFVCSVSSFAFWAAFLAPAVPKRYLARSTPADEPVHPSFSSNEINVHIPQTGMLHPESRHRTHCDMELKSTPVPEEMPLISRSLAVASYKLAKVDDWACNDAQRAAVLQMEAPDWFSAS